MGRHKNNAKSDLIQNEIIKLIREGYSRRECSEKTGYSMNIVNYQSRKVIQRFHEENTEFARDIVAIQTAQTNMMLQKQIPALSRANGATSIKLLTDAVLGTLNHQAKLNNAYAPEKREFTFIDAEKTLQELMQKLQIESSPKQNPEHQKFENNEE